MKIGLHVSIANGIDQAPLKAMEQGAECFQIFSRSPRGGTAPAITETTINRLKENLNQAKIDDFYIHTPYYINLASPDSAIYNRSINLIREDLLRGTSIGAKALMTHLGSYLGRDPKTGRKKVLEAIIKILTGYRGGTIFLIENSAGSGNIIGSKLEEIGWLIARAESRLKGIKIGLCYDTCHGFASGYDIRNGTALKGTLKKINDIIGLERVKLIHANDSKTPLNSRKDRHEHIGLGEIGYLGFKLLLNEGKLKTADMILETPKEGRKDRQTDLNVLKNLRAG